LIARRHFHFLMMRSFPRLQRPVAQFRLMLRQLEWMQSLSLTTVRRSWLQEERLPRRFYLAIRAPWVEK
jgi:hypothetical protein